MVPPLALHGELRYDALNGQGGGDGVMTDTCGSRGIIDPGERRVARRG
jgi:hypothetical protein